MANENLEILEGSGTPKRLGKLPAKARRQQLQFSDFYKFLNLPPVANYWQKKTPIALRHYGNLQYGDCTIASQANAQTRFQRQERHPIVVTDEEVIRVYQNLSDRLYGGGDNGAYETDALDNWRDSDLTFRDSKGHPMTIQAYLAINPKNLDEVRAAIALSAGKGIKVCFALPAAYSSMDPPATWGVPADGKFTGAWMPNSWGGHSIFMNGYNKQGGILDHTWELPNNLVTWDAMAAYMDEAHLVIDSLDNWKAQVKAQTAVKFSLADVRDAVNSVSTITI